MTKFRDYVPPNVHAALNGLLGRRYYFPNLNMRRSIFIQIPKTGGSSVATALFGRGCGHNPWFEYYRNDPVKFTNYFKFAYVRNPWDRLVSGYFYLLAGGNYRADRIWAQKHLSGYLDFDDFVHRWVNEKNVTSGIHFMPQAHFILDSDDSVKVDFLGRYEHLEEDFAYVASRLNCDAILPRMNSSDHSYYMTYYTDETRELVGQVYARDVAAFGYTFDNSATGMGRANP